LTLFQAVTKPVLKLGPWLPRVIFQLSPWAYLATVNAVQPPAWPSWEPECTWAWWPPLT
jgi:hypothetical protein